MATLLELASSADITRILGWTHGTWGASLDFATYEARTRALLATPWGRSRYRFYLGRDEAGQPVCACKHYVFDVTVAGEPLTAIGFGAVFTHPDARHQGHAARMLSQLMELGLADGHAFALLYSDIDPAYYERLGFRRFGGRAGETRALSAREGLWTEAGITFEATLPDFRYERHPDYASYLIQRNRVRTWRYQSGPGYVVGQIGTSRFAVSEAHRPPDVSPERFWQDVRRLAPEDGVVAGWLPEEAEAGGFWLKEIDDGVPMVASLGGRSLPRAATLWELDHF